MIDSGGILRLHAILEPRGPAGAIVLTDEQVAALGGTRTPPVRVTVNDVSVSARVGRMGGENLLGLSKKLRADLGVEIGQSMDVVVALDTQPRTVAPPALLAAAFASDAEAGTAFRRLAPSHQKEFARWIEEAKREDTRRRRVEETVRLLREGRTRR